MTEQLRISALNLEDGVSVYLYLPAANNEAVALATTLGMHTVFETARMYKGPPPQLPTHQIFGITTFELG